MAAIQLNFSLRTSANCKTVHLLGSWDNYAGQLPLFKDANKVGGWKGTFRFQGQTLRQGQRYWYYYIIDGYHVSHDPAREAVVEPTTGRKLNVLDIPAGKPTAAAPASTRESSRAKRSSRHLSINSNVARGRPLSQSEIRSPKPCKPQETHCIRTEQFNRTTLEQLSAQFAASNLDDDEEDSDSDSDIDSDVDSDVPSLTSSRSSNTSSPSSAVSSASSLCSCERYGITRAGDRVKLDCGGSRCGYSDGSDCEDDEVCHHKARPVNTRRHGMLVAN